MEGVIINFRRGRHVTSHNQMVVLIKEVDTKEKAAKLVGKKVIWESPTKKQLIGKVSAPHGGKGAVRVLFETGMPGQSVGKKVKID